MDTNISMSIKQLIQLDQKSVALEKDSEEQLKLMENSFEKQMEDITGELQHSKDEAKALYMQLINKAEEEARQLASEAEVNLQNVEKRVTLTIGELAEELWDKIKDRMK